MMERTNVESKDKLNVCANGDSNLAPLSMLIGGPRQRLSRVLMYA